MGAKILAAGAVLTSGSLLVFFVTLFSGGPFTLTRLKCYIPNEISHEISNVKFHEISLVKFSSCFSEISKFCCVEEIGSGRRLFVLDATLFFGGLALSLHHSNCEASAERGTMAAVYTDTHTHSLSLSQPAVLSLLLPHTPP